MEGFGFFDDNASNASEANAPLLTPRTNYERLARTAERYVLLCICVCVRVHLCMCVFM
jgi:hypothetical protein